MNGLNKRFYHSEDSVFWLFQHKMALMIASGEFECVFFYKICEGTVGLSELRINIFNFPKGL